MSEVGSFSAGADGTPGNHIDKLDLGFKLTQLDHLLDNIPLLAEPHELDIDDIAGVEGYPLQDGIMIEVSPYEPHQEHFVTIVRGMTGTNTETMYQVSERTIRRRITSDETLFATDESTLSLFVEYDGNIPILDEEKSSYDLLMGEVVIPVGLLGSSYETATEETQYDSYSGNESVTNAHLSELRKLGDKVGNTLRIRKSN